MNIVKEKYEFLCNEVSDINEHLPTLCKYAAECESIIECGVRGCVSSWALLYGLLNNQRPVKQLMLNDLQPCDIHELFNISQQIGRGVEVKYEWGNDLNIEIHQNYDLLFIDTWHIYGQLKRELHKFSPFINKYIIMHDTTTDEIEGETVRNKWNAEYQSLICHIPVEEINCGLGKAIDEFLLFNTNWVLHEKWSNNNGLTILKRIG